MNRLLACLAVFAVLAAGHVRAQSAEKGLMNAVLYNPLPAGAAVTVSPLDNSDDNMILQKVFETDLAARGYKISADAPLILSFETRDVVGAYTSRDARHVLELSGGGGQGGGEDTKARVNVFDSNTGGLLNPGRDTGDTHIVTPTQYRMDVTIDRRDNGSRLWQAWALADLGQSDGLTLTRAMVPVITRAIGKTVRQQPFTVP